MFKRACVFLVLVPFSILRAESCIDALVYSDQKLEYGEDSTLADYTLVAATWLKQMVHNSGGIAAVLDITRFRPLKGGLIGSEHPWCTGKSPQTGEPIWYENVLFATPRDKHYAKTDEQILSKVGHYMASMVKRSASTEEFPDGLPETKQGRRLRRMPHGINYIHGAVHYNGGWLLFNNFEEARFYFSSPKFRREIYRFSREQKRELIVVFREKEYDYWEYAYFVAFMRSVLPFFSNSNGPTKQQVLWGNPAPYAVVNTILGNWMLDIYKMKDPSEINEIVRPPVPKARYFHNGPYKGTRRRYLWTEKFLAWATNWRIRLRGDRGNLFFVDEAELKP